MTSRVSVSFVPFWREIYDFFFFFQNLRCLYYSPSNVIFLINGYLEVCRELKSFFFYDLKWKIEGGSRFSYYSSYLLSFPESIFVFETKLLLCSIVFLKRNLIKFCLFSMYRTCLHFKHWLCNLFNEGTFLLTFRRDQLFWDWWPVTPLIIRGILFLLNDVYIIGSRVCTRSVFMTLILKFGHFRLRITKLLVTKVPEEKNFF